ncbi:MAG: nucleotidyl transferase AbiEii/AbiGii toxin family protein, partial [Candidatus Binatia bacterium]
ILDGGARSGIIFSTAGGVTGSFSANRLSELQRRLITAFAARAPGFFLTGGAVLCGFELGHRRTDDLDFFTIDDEAMAEGERALRAAAAEIGAGLESVLSAPDHHRFVARVGDEAVLVDLVRDRVVQLREKVDRGGVRTDPVEEIVANKICALVGRSEIRDLVDLFALEGAGYRVEDFLDDAAKKDGGATPATIAWLLSTLAIPDTLPSGFDPRALREFAADLERRMRKRAAPASD